MSRTFTTKIQKQRRVVIPLLDFELGKFSEGEAVKVTVQKETQ